MNGLLGIQAEANRQAMERDAMNVRGGMLREDPGLMQRIGSTVADYAVPDRYLPSSVMSPRLDMSKLEALRGTPVDMADVPSPVPMLMDTMPMAGITAWHGSPHKFSKFDMSKIGTGEGAQAYGHGLYMAENPSVAKDYKEKLGNLPNMIHYDGTPLINLPAGEKEALNQLERAMPIFKGPKVGGGKLGFSDSVEFARNKMKDNPAGTQFLDNVDESKIAWGDGNLYKVDIPDDQIAKMLDWDKPLSEQGEKMHNVWEKFLGSGVGKRSKKSFGMDDEYVPNRPGNFNQPTGEEFHNLIYEGMPRAKGQTYGGGATSQEGDMTAAWLKRQGIPGIKYADQGSRGKYHVQLKYKGEPYGEPVELSAKNQVQEFVKEYEAKGFGTEVVDQGTSNFVLFDDRIPQILEINGKPLKGMLGE